MVMRRMALLLLGAVIPLSACSVGDVGSVGRIAVAAEGETLEGIDCTASYRPRPGSPGTEETLSVEAEQDSQIHADRARFRHMSVKITYFDDGFESPAFNVIVRSPGRPKDLAARLYQFQRVGDEAEAPAEKPDNEFVGGHGFTGLGYVFDVDSRAEIQYFCNAR